MSGDPREAFLQSLDAQRRAEDAELSRIVSTCTQSVSEATLADAASAIDRGRLFGKLAKLASRRVSSRDTKAVVLSSGARCLLRFMVARAFNELYDIAERTRGSSGELSPEARFARAILHVMSECAKSRPIEDPLFVSRGPQD